MREGDEIGSKTGNPARGIGSRRLKKSKYDRKRTADMTISQCGGSEVRLCFATNHAGGPWRLPKQKRIRETGRDQCGD
jgi:hypothetical protein